MNLPSPHEAYEVNKINLVESEGLKKLLLESKFQTHISLDYSDNKYNDVKKNAHKRSRSQQHKEGIVLPLKYRFSKYL